MSTTIKTGWLKNNNGEKFAPKTLSSQVMTSDGIVLEDKITTELDNLENNFSEQLNNKANTNHNHDDVYYTESEIDAKLDEKSDKNHTHDLSTYETKDDASTKLEEAKEYADTAIANLVGTAPESLDTIHELAEAFEENADVVEAINQAIANKADKDHAHDIYETKEDATVKYDTIVEAKADWNQNDETAIDYVKNRTHWVEQTIEEIVGEQGVVLVETVDIYRANLTNIITAPPCEEDEGYVITIDGVSYNCTSWIDYAYDATNTIFIGDSRMWGTEDPMYNTHPENVPFLIEFYFEGGGGWFGEDLTLSDATIYFADANFHTVKIERELPDQTTYHTLDEKYIPDSIARTNNVITRIDPVVEGSFSLNRKAGSEIGYHSFSEGQDTIASGSMSHAEGERTIASGFRSHAEGYATEASGANSHAEGWGTIASGDEQHVQGVYNIEDTSNIFAHIVGNGSSSRERSNAHTLDWDGNAWYAGTIKVGGTSYDDASEVALKSDLDAALDNIDLSAYETKANASSTYETKENAQFKYDELNNIKKDKDIIVTYQEGSNFGVTHSSTEIFNAINNGQTVKFRKGTELLDVLEATADYITFYMFYVNMEGKLHQIIVVISGNSIMLEQDDTYDYATKNEVNAKADKTHTHTEYETVENASSKYDEFSEGIASKQDALTGTEGQVVQFNTEGKPVASDLELITIDDIDAICGGSIQYAEEVLF